MPWVTEHLSELQIADLCKQIEVAMRAAIDGHAITFQGVST